MKNRTEHINQLLQSLPDNPGVYQYYNDTGVLIYVGKAKSLKKRVSSYFNKNIYENAKTQVMVKQICDIKYILTVTEYDALLLENNLIKKHQPRYNVNLKDDKTYPWIIIKREPFPRVFYTRKKINDGSTYLGPYASVRMMHVMLDLIKELFKLRTCNLSLTQENISKNKFKVCLEYHIGNCLGPCEGRQQEDDYNQTIVTIKDILKGNLLAVMQHLEIEMNRAATNYQFEQAHNLKQQLDILEKFKSKSVIVNPAITNADVVTLVSEGSSAFANYMHVVNGSIVQAQTIEIKKKLDETLAELMTIAITEMRLRYESTSKEVIVNIEPDIMQADITYTVPKQGDKRQLLLMSEKNANFFMTEKLAQYDKLNPEHKIERLMELMKKDLRLSTQPRLIECFDNSNFQGTDAVAAMSVFRDGKPSKRDYRHFNIKTVTGPDDFASMEEVIYRRYKRVLEEKLELPHLIVIDGGKGQLSAALNSLEKLELRNKVGIIGIAKRLEEIYFPGDPLPLYLDKKGETLKIIQHLRDEVHRFGITHHRNKRSKGLIKTELQQIKGIGKTISETLLRHFKSVKKIKEADTDELEKVIGKTKAALVINYFNKKEDDKNDTIET